MCREGFSVLELAPSLILLSCIGTTAHPKGSEEDMSTPRQTSQEDGHTQFNHGEIHEVQ